VREQRGSGRVPTSASVRDFIALSRARGLSRSDHAPALTGSRQRLRARNELIASGAVPGERGHVTFRVEARGRGGPSRRRHRNGASERAEGVAPHQHRDRGDRLVERELVATHFSVAAAAEGGT
jgi:hypothetical protein